jgi:hypothetical protein
VALITAAGPVLAPAAEVKQEKVNGYAEWRQGDLLVVDGQRVRLAAGGKFKGSGDAKSPSSIPLGYEVKATGTRSADGVLLARELESKPNGSAMFEKDVRSMTDDAENQYRRAGSFYQDGAGGRRQTVGRLYEDGPEVERVRAIMDALVPPYLDRDALRTYVIDNDEWNAFAMGNYSIYVFTGLLRDMDDDELAIVLGHELAHATHEHTRRQFKKQMWIQLLAAGVVGAGEEINDKNKRALVQLLAVFGAAAWSNGYGRDLEDQADRVGLRYAYEAGFDISKGPRLWNRFAKRYGEQGKVANFFFGDHSLSRQRALNLERELTLNYAEGPKDERPRLARGRPSGSTRTAGGARPASDERVSALVSGSATGSTGRAAAGRSSNKEIQVGMTEDEVRALLGAPSERVTFGSQVKWSYPNLSVVFERGKVKDVRF